MVGHPANATLFMHEDFCLMLTFEIELQHWRTAELRVGQIDTGRSQYEQVIGVSDYMWFIHRTSNPGCLYGSRSVQQ
jgi:hypothetical protein